MTKDGGTLQMTKEEHAANDKGVAKRARSSTYLYLEIDMHSVFP